MKKAYIVIGTGESTGCRFVTKLLLNCGIYGTAEHTQEFQSVMYDDRGFALQVKEKQLQNLVVRQSQPHGSNLPSLYDWYNRLKNSGFGKIYTIITTRAQAPQIVSTVKSGHLYNNPVNNFLKDPNIRIKSAYKAIMGDLIKIEDGNYFDFIVVNLTDLQKHSECNIRFMLESVDISIPQDFNYNIVKDVDSERVKEFCEKNYGI